MKIQLSTPIAFSFTLIMELYRQYLEKYKAQPTVIFIGSTHFCNVDFKFIRDHLNTGELCIPIVFGSGLEHNAIILTNGNMIIEYHTEL